MDKGAYIIEDFPSYYAYMCSSVHAYFADGKGYPAVVKTLEKVMSQPGEMGRGVSLANGRDFDDCYNEFIDTGNFKYYVDEETSKNFVENCKEVIGNVGGVMAVDTLIGIAVFCETTEFLEKCYCSLPAKVKGYTFYKETPDMMGFFDLCEIKPDKIKRFMSGDFKATTDISKCVEHYVNAYHSVMAECLENGEDPEMRNHELNLNDILKGNGIGERPDKEQGET